MDHQPIDLQALLGELIWLRRENEETRDQLAQHNGSRVPAPNPAPVKELHAPTPERFADGVWVREGRDQRSSGQEED
ncbi:hypothetical protein RI367_008754 [Sorochytrium milnesiophthora]